MNNSVNNAVKKSFRNLFVALALFGALFMSANIRAQEKKNSKGQEFYIVGSVDRAKSQILLKLPTEVTVMMKVDDKTQFFDASGKAIKLTDLRSGATVWVNASGGDQPTATRIALGAITVPQLHELYLDYPVIN